MAKFFRFFLHCYEERMKIPVKFAQLLTDQSDTAANTASISSPLGKMWHVELSRDSINTYFTKGWPEFVEAHQIEFGYLMVFSYKGQSNFSVEIFDHTTCLKEYNHISSGKRNDQRDLQFPEGRLTHDVSPNGSNSNTKYEDGNSEYTTEGNETESSCSNSEDFDSYDTGSTVPDTTRVKDLKNGKGKKAKRPSNVDKKTQNSDNEIKLHSGRTVNGGVNQRGKRSNNSSELEKNVNSNALSIPGYIFKTISEAYNLNYMPLKKAFCDNSKYQLRRGMAMVRNENLEAYPVRYRVCGTYNFLGKGWRKFCDANNVRMGDRCLIKIIGDNEFLVSVKHH